MYIAQGQGLNHDASYELQVTYKLGVTSKRKQSYKSCVLNPPSLVIFADSLLGFSSRVLCSVLEP